MSNNMVPESYPMNGGDGTYSYTKNSYLQREATNVVKAMTDDAIIKKLDVKKFSSTSENTLRIADLGCSVGPNTFIAMQNIIDVQQKYHSQGLATHVPEFQVFFNDHASNDFNTLFTCLPPERPYFATGVPGSFYGRLFPESSLHFVHSSYALQWLSKVPEELQNKNSAAWNKGRIHYTNANAPDEVAHAYTSQFTKDMTTFLDSRAKELVVGGLMVLIMPGIPNGIPRSSGLVGVTFDFLGLSLMDMANEGLISEAQVDSFNFPVYVASPKEMTQLVERNGCFVIEKMEITCPHSRADGPSSQAVTMHLRAGMGGVISKHFGDEIIDEVFDRFYKKHEEFSSLPESKNMEATQLFIALKRV